MQAELFLKGEAKDQLPCRTVAPWSAETFGNAPVQTRVISRKRIHASTDVRKIMPCARMGQYGFSRFPISNGTGKIVGQFRGHKTLSTVLIHQPFDQPFCAFRFSSAVPADMSALAVTCQQRPTGGLKLTV